MDNEIGNEIARLYVTFFNRVPDPEGFEYWMGRYASEVANGQDAEAFLEEIADSFAQSPEAKAIFEKEGNPTRAQIEAYITDAYSNVFDRAPDDIGLAYWADRWETEMASGRAGVRVLFEIENAARNSTNLDDIAALGHKAQIAAIFTAEFMQSDFSWSPVHLAWAGDVLEGVDSSDASYEEALAKIEEYFDDEPSGGQAPGGGGTRTTFTVDVEGGELQFGGSARGDISVGVTDDGLLQFGRAGRIAVLNSDETIASIQSDAHLLSTFTGEEGETSDVLARDKDGGWYFVENVNFPIESDGLDFYTAINDSANVLLLDGFDVSDIDRPTVLEGLMNSPALGDPEALLDMLDFLAHGISADSNIAIAATESAKTSLNPLIMDLIAGLQGSEFPEEALPEFDLPNIGMPIFLENGATELSVSGKGGFILGGNIDAIHGAISMLVEGGEVGDPLETLRQGSDDTIRGRDGDDIILGLGDTGSWSWPETPVEEEIATLVAARPEILFARNEDDQLAGDHLWGGDGKDIFVHIDLLEIYSDGVDWIHDFGQGGTDLLVIAVEDGVDICIEKVDADDDGEIDDTVLFFNGDEEGGNSAIVLVDFAGASEAGTIQIDPLGIYIFSSETAPLPFT